ncbi:MAG: XRE family transcriptional regulator [Steroidobacteraceae bacterium]
MDINARIARRLKDLRDELGLSIEQLSVRSGVSRGMISKIEREECSPTATVLNKLSIGLGVLVPTFFGPASYREPRLQQRNPVSARKGQIEWQDPESGYQRRTLTPSTAKQPLQLSEIHFPAGAKVTLENPGGAAMVQQQIWMLEGHMELLIGSEPCHLGPGDCVAMTLDSPVTFHNPGRKEARYLVAITAKSGR